MRRLIDTRSICPPGEWRYEQTYGNKSVKRFNSCPEFSTLCKRVSDFRKANRLARPSIQEVSRDVEDYMIAQPGVGDNPRYSFESDPTNTQAIGVPSSTGGCGTCGAPVT